MDVHAQLSHLLQMTVATVRTRARRHRNLVVTLVVIGILSIAAAVVLASWLPLLFLLVGIPVTCFAILIDARLMCVWQESMLKPWVDDELNLASFAHGLRAQPGLPHGTIESMLRLLPLLEPSRKPGGPSRDTKRAIAACAAAAGAYEKTRMTILTVAVACAVAGLMATVLTRSVVTLISVIVVVLTLGIGRWLERSHLGTLRRTLEQLAGADDPDPGLTRDLLCQILQLRLTRHVQRKLFSQLAWPYPEKVPVSKS